MSGSVTGMSSSVIGMPGSVTGMSGSVTGMSSSVTGMSGSVTGMSSSVTGMAGSVGYGTNGSFDTDMNPVMDSSMSDGLSGWTDEDASYMYGNLDEHGNLDTSGGSTLYGTGSA
jgi:type VI secretion system secreted protein VgrG